MIWRVLTPVAPAADGTPRTALDEAGIGAHVGAFSDQTSKKFKPIGTAGTADFHDWLRDRFSNPTALTPPAYADSLKTQIINAKKTTTPDGTPTKAWLWDGILEPQDKALVDHPIGVVYRVQGLTPSITVRELAAMQVKNFEETMTRFEDTKNKLLAQEAASP